MTISDPHYSNSKLLRPVNFSNHDVRNKGGMIGLVLLAIGVVFGDIGTSPLYALKVCFDPQSGIPMTTESIYGVLSMVFWAFIFVVSLKYVFFVMRANNHGEGGILALMALALRTTNTGSKKALILMIVGILGACLFYGDAVITPAISVLSAVEGMSVVSGSFTKWVLPITISILLLLFVFEKKGTSIVGAFFGPIMLVWFLVIACMGIYQIAEAPEIFRAMNPLYALHFIMNNSVIAFAVTGSIFLVLTGTEALYADMGHFGFKPIQFAWFLLVFPALLVNYFGQGAMLLQHPESVSNPFFLMVPETFTLGLVILSTVATVIASQACISGAYSMTSQAILLGFIPRMKVIFTSEREVGQIYVPFINWLLCFIVIGIVLAFKKSDNLASAYGIAVSTTMLMTTILAAVVMKSVWKWNFLLVAVLTTLFMIIDLGFFLANLSKIGEGGWFPLMIGSLCFLLMMTWYQGRKILRGKAIDNGIRIDTFIPSLLKMPPHRVDGTAVFLTAHIDYVPTSLLHNLKHNRILHKRVIFLKVSVWDVPRISDDKRIDFKDLGDEVYIVRAIYGFKETPDISKIIKLLHNHYGIKFTIAEASFFLAREHILAKQIPQMSMWRELLFIWMMNNASKTADFFKIESGRVIELGSQIEM